MEQYYGPTASFKDLALQLFPLFFQESIKHSKEKNIILVATSGDTGSAVLSGFQGTSTSVVVLYPKGGVRYLER
jgi:threonine synthase